MEGFLWMEKHILLQIIVSLGLAVILRLLFRLYNSVVATRRRLRRVLKQQGIGGPPTALLLGNILEIKKAQVSTLAAAAGPPVRHNCGEVVFSFLEKWRRQYGDIFTFSLGNKPMVLVNKYEVVKEVTSCTSHDLGKPSYLAADLEPLLGNGIVTSNGKIWASHRKILAPELFYPKVKGMTHLIQQSTMTLVDSWKGVIDGEGGKADIQIDDDLRKFSGDVISRACFGSSYAEAEQFFKTLKSLQQITSKKGFALGIPGMRYLPTKNNRRAWRLQRDLKKMILNLVKQKNDAKSEKNMLQMILEGAASSNLSPDAIEKFTIDNVKNIYLAGYRAGPEAPTISGPALAGYETTAIAATWCLMLLASNPDRQHRLREEVVGVCNGQVPDSDSLRRMKQLTMVINESLRLYPPVTIMSREALNELEFGGVRIPKGAIIWILVTTLHTDPAIWGPDSYEFKPERFADGTAAACKLPHMFMPFGVGPRICLGMNLAMAELKMLLALILSNFSFSLPPNYVHAPVMKLVLQPKNGIDIVFEKLKVA